MKTSSVIFCIASLPYLRHHMCHELHPGHVSRTASHPAIDDRTIDKVSLLSLSLSLTHTHTHKQLPVVQYFHNLVLVNGAAPVLHTHTHAHTRTRTHTHTHVHTHVHTHNTHTHIHRCVSVYIQTHTLTTHMTTHFTTYTLLHTSLVTFS